MKIDPAESSPSMRQYILEMVLVVNTYIEINTSVWESIQNPYITFLESRTYSGLK